MPFSLWESKSTVLSHSTLISTRYVMCSLQNLKKTHRLEYLLVIIIRECSTYANPNCYRKNNKYQCRRATMRTSILKTQENWIIHKMLLRTSLSHSYEAIIILPSAYTVQSRRLRLLLRSCCSTWQMIRHSCRLKLMNPLRSQYFFFVHIAVLLMLSFSQLKFD